MSYFKFDEFICPCCNKGQISSVLFEMLNEARGVALIPFVINSGFRCPDHNRAWDGKPYSAHVRGNSVVIKCVGCRIRYIILKSLLDAGFERIGIYPSFIHADVDPDLDPEVAWLS